MAMTDYPVMRHGEHEEVNVTTGSVVDAAMKVHSHFGPGLLERIYKLALARALERRGHRVLTEVAIPVSYLMSPWVPPSDWTSSWTITSL